MTLALVLFVATVGVWVPWKGPQWLAGVLFLIAVAASVALRVVQARRWWRRRKRQIAGLCPECGYDLRATPGRCPECGAVPKPSNPDTAAADVPHSGQRPGVARKS